MTKEQEEVIERLNRFKTIKVLYCSTFAMTIEQLKVLQEDIETALSMLKEKDTELEKKDKIIDLILDKFKEGTGYYYSEFDYMNKEQLKQYFERKVRK